MKRPAKIAALSIILIGLAYLFFFTPIRSYLTEESIRTFTDQFGIFAPAAYGLLYYIIVLTGISAAVFTILAGILFGKLIGTTVVVIAATASASTAFIIGRFFGKGATDKLAKSKKVGPWIQKIEKQVKKQGFQAFFIMRCLFLPYIYLSYAAGLVKSAKLSDFTWATLVTNIVFSFMFVYLGDNIFKGPKALILPVILVILALQVPKIIKKFRKKI